MTFETVKYIKNPKWPLVCGLAAILGTFTVLPIVLSLMERDLPSEFMTIASLSALASFGLAVGYFTLPSRTSSLLRIYVDLQMFTTVALVIIAAYACVLISLAASAGSIPLIDALNGAAIDGVSEARENFLKARRDWTILLVYAHAVLASSMMPYVIAGGFSYKLRKRYVILAGFCLGCTLFVEKAFFLKALMPVAAVQWRRGLWGAILPLGVLSIVIFFVLSVISTRNLSNTSVSQDDATLKIYFSSSYAEASGVSLTNYLAWRAIAVPIFTATDSLLVFDGLYESHNFWGATSSLIASVSHQERIPFERSVFEFQWGQNATGTGSSNTVFFVEAFVNFGVPGVLVFSIAAGIMLGLLARSSDPALSALWPLFLFGIYTSGLIGVLLSNGFIAVVFMSILIRLPKRNMIERDQLKKYEKGLL